jgi:hypothetical protein
MSKCASVKPSKSIRNALIVAGSLLLTSHTLAGLFDKAPQPIVLEAGTDREAAFKTLFLNENLMARDQNKPYEGPVRPLAMASVKLMFITDTSASSSSGDKGATVDVNYKLVGLPPATMQAVADDFASTFAAALAARGYAVLEQDKVLANDDFRKLVTETAGPQESNGLTKALASNSGVTVLGKGTADTFTMTGYSKGADLAKALGTTTVHANLIIGFAKLANSGSFKSAEVDHGVKLSISPKSMFMVMGDDGSIKQFQFRQEVVLPSQIAAKVADVGRTGGQTALLIFNALAGGGSGAIKNYEVTPVENYRELVTADLKMVAEVLAQGLKKN